LTPSGAEKEGNQEGDSTARILVDVVIASAVVEEEEADTKYPVESKKDVNILIYMSFLYN
jgi:hypothetical protein